MDELLLLSKAMADKNRLRIVALIRREKALCVCEICDTLGLSQPLVSRHLRQLKTAGVLQSRKEGKWALYEITDTPSALLSAYLEAIKPFEDSLGKTVACSMK